jgi:bifunctional enzyme CysN/CysC/sulfate adenylyltransferase subunit 1
MHEQPLVVGRTYIAKHTTRTVRATVRRIDFRVDVNSLDHQHTDSLAMNEIAEVEFETNLPLFFDTYSACRWTGSLILIEALSNATVGAAMIVAPVADTSTGATRRPALILLPNRSDLAERVQDALGSRGERAIVIDDALIPDSSIAAVVRALDLAGIIAISSRTLAKDTIASIESFASGAVRVEEGADDEAILDSLAGQL